MITNKRTEKVIRLYEFLKEYQKIKSPVIAHLNEQEWSSDRERFVMPGKDDVLFSVEKDEQESATLFDEVYTLYARMKKEPESIELVYGDVVVAQGEAKYHPIVLQTMSLEFEPENQRFTMYLSDKMPELYLGYLSALEGVSEEGVIDIVKGFAKNPISPFDDKGLQELIQQVESIKETPQTLKVSQKGVLFLRKRHQGFGTAIDYIIEDMIKGKEVPPFIADIVGMGDLARKNQKSKESLRKLTVDVNGIDQKVLFTKSANKEQLLVAKHLERNEAVLVQGPPGTGKTHTIANIIGHYLAEGKSILVTSYSEKALGVVKNQVPKDLQSLCVSVLGDAESRKELEKSLEMIQQKRGTLERGELARRVAMYEKNREACLKTLDKLKAEMKAIKLNEYTPIKVAGKMYKPVEAAKYVAEHKEACKWLMGPVRPGAMLPLSEEKIIKLYELQHQITEEDQWICNWEVDLGQLITPEIFKQLVAYDKKVKKQDAPAFLKYFKATEGGNQETLQALLGELELMKEGLQNEEKWCVHALEAGKDDKAKEQWQSLISDVKEVYQLSMTYADEFVAREPQLMPMDEKIKPLDVYSQINQKLQSGGKLSKITLLLNPQMKAVIGASRINDRQPESMAEFETLIHYTVLAEKRAALQLRWDRQMVPLGAPAVKEMGEQFEVTCQKYCEAVGRYLDWYKKKWHPLLRNLQAVGLDSVAIMESKTFDVEVGSEINYIRDTFIKEAVQLLQYEIGRLDKDEATVCKQQMEQCINQYQQGTKSEKIMGLKRALRTNHVEDYTCYYDAICEAKEKVAIIREREDLLDKLAFAAPGWAEALRQPATEDTEWLPTNVEEAWLWRQFVEVLEKRMERTATAVKDEMKEVEKRLTHYTMQLTLDKSWLHKLVDFDANRSEVQAIEGWKQLMMRIGAGKGKQAEMLRAEARKLMPKCQKAVPVWIMPLNKVADHFDPRENKFDLVIIDEASQADMMALIALYLGKQVLIVGDHEQVSPLAIGERGEDMDRLVKTYLADMPNHYLYSGRFSIYDLAGVSGYQPVRLREHFRCVPEIIGYSNELAYNGQIEPLREGGGKNLQPPIRMMQVMDGKEEGQINKKEAACIVETLLECCQMPAYEGKTFGVISLKGDRQANYIDQLLQKEMSATAYEKRQILCGNPSHFQGDERDVIFISFVDSAEAGDTLRLITYGTDNLYKKRYNVAMSRGREQVCLVYSFDPETQIKEEDIRKPLFAYAANVGKDVEQEGALYEEPLTEFEAYIKEKLVKESYKVVSHTTAGIQLNSMIVERNGRKVRLVCDSEKWQEEIALDEEMNGQAVLERIGWTFVYLSATAFYMDEVQQFQLLKQKLRENGL